MAAMLGDDACRAMVDAHEEKDMDGDMTTLPVLLRLWGRGVYFEGGMGSFEADQRLLWLPKEKPEAVARSAAKFWLANEVRAPMGLTVCKSPRRMLWLGSIAVEEATHAGGKMGS